ncbi:MAG TPA: peptide ABC transporter ATP-binding protein [Rhodospirillaceae bacterium]|nr:peptide ABC transporter ATP-binding protein [Rhodospirillaceae bacterium]
MLRAKNITFGYTEKKIFEEISMTIKTGSITTLIGPSGSGKTTLLRCLALLERPESGSIQIDKDMYSWPWPEEKEFILPYPKLTTVFQQLFLWPHMTLRENIMLPDRLSGRERKGARIQLAEMVEMFEMGDFINRYPNEVSLGQRQRVALARALILQPRYLLLDEITSSLDVEQVAKILDCLKHLRDKDIGIFIVTHLLGFARDAADQVAFLADGQLMEVGGPEILKHPKSKRLSRFLSIIEAAS